MKKDKTINPKKHITIVQMKKLLLTAAVALVSLLASAQSLTLEYNNSGDRKRLAGEERSVVAISEGGSSLQSIMEE